MELKGSVAMGVLLEEWYALGLKGIELHFKLFY